MPVVTFTIGGKGFDLSPQDVTSLISLSLNFNLPKSLEEIKVFIFLWISIYSRSVMELRLSAPAVSPPWISRRLVDLSGNSHLQNPKSTNQKTQMGLPKFL